MDSPTGAARQALLEKITAIEPVLAAHRDAAELQGRLADPVVEAMLDAGVGRLYMPRGLGGLEVDPLCCAAITEQLARIDTSAAWFVMVTNSAKINAAYWPEALVELVWGDDADVVVAASGNRPFNAIAEGKGYRLNGVNGFVSGCHHADWLMSPIIADGEFMMALLPMQDCEIIDNWHSLGMRGTGSNDVRADNVWIPDSQVVAMQQPPPPRNRYYQGNLYLCPSRILFATYVPVTLVLAEQALSELSRLAQDKTPYAETAKLKHRSIAQIKYGKALANFRASRAFFLSALDDAWKRTESGIEASREQKADLYLAGTHAVQNCAQVVRWVADAAGTSVIYQDQPLQRIVRDMETLRHHGFASESRYGSVAQLYWDVDLDYPLILR